jgi:hypothetical protein
MVKLEGPDVAVVAAEAAGSARIGDQNLLQAPASPETASERQRRQRYIPRASSQNSVRPCLAHSSSILSGWTPRTPPAFSDERELFAAHASEASDVRSTDSSRSAPRSRVWKGPPAPTGRACRGRSLPSAHDDLGGRPKSVLLDPVADGRGVAPGQPADRLKGKPPPQIRLQNLLLHHTNTSSRAGRNQASSAVPASRSAPPDDFSIASVFASIWRTRSRVTPTS